MFDNEWFKKRKKYSPHDIFDEVEKIEKIILKILENFISHSNFKSNLNKPFIYEFSISTKPNSQPIIREIGNVNINLSHPLIREDFEPLIDIIEDEKTTKIYVELPGVKKKNIKLRLKSRKLIIKVVNEDKKYYKEIDLPFDVNAKNVKATYRNGVLEIIINKNPTGEGTSNKLGD